MNKIRKKLYALLFVFGLLMGLLPQTVFAQENSGRIRIIQSDIETKKPVAGVKLTLYQVAECSDIQLGDYQLTEDFKDSGLDPDKLHDEREYGKNIELLDRYIENNAITGMETRITDQDGVVEFSGLQDGIYFIRQTNSQQDFDDLGYTFVTDSYLIELPWTNADGEVTRTVNCQPKGKLEYPEDTKDIVVYKVWKDSSDKAGKRPEQITVGLYGNDILIDEVTLSAENNWTYQWKDLDANIEWEVKETDVPSGYVSEVTSAGTEFTITNTLNSPGTPPEPDSPGSPGSPVKTGDETNIELFAGLFLLSSVVLILLWFRKMKRRETKAE